MTKFTDDEVDEFVRRIAPTYMSRKDSFALMLRLVNGGWTPPDLTRFYAREVAGGYWYLCDRTRTLPNGLENNVAVYTPDHPNSPESACKAEADRLNREADG